MSISEAEAKLKLSILNSNAIELDRVDTVTKLTNMGLSQEVITRIEDLWEKTKIIGGQVIHIGKVILAEIMKFIKENPLLAPLVTAVSVVVGGVAGLRLDRGEGPRDDFIGVTQEVILIAKKFFELFANIFNALQGEFSQE